MADEPVAAGRTLVLSVDLEDWHQLVGKRYGLEGWDRPHAAFEEQTEVILGLLDELGVKATFFALGMSARPRIFLVGRSRDAAFFFSALCSR